MQIFGFLGWIFTKWGCVIHQSQWRQDEIHGFRQFSRDYNHLYMRVSSMLTNQQELPWIALLNSPNTKWGTARFNSKWASLWRTATSWCPSSHFRRQEAHHLQSTFLTVWRISGLILPLTQQKPHLASKWTNTWQNLSQQRNKRQWKYSTTFSKWPSISSPSMWIHIHACPSTKLVWSHTTANSSQRFVRI